MFVDPNTIKNKAKTGEFCGRKTSWVWDHFTKTTKDLANCNICNISITRRNAGTSAIANHLLTHSIKKPSEEVKEQEYQKPSWVWKYFTKTNKNSVNCKVCNADITRHNAGTSAMSNHLMTHSIKETSENPEERKIQKRSWVWEYYTKAANDWAECNICNINITRRNAGTSAMTNHLMTHSIKRPESFITIKKGSAKTLKNTKD